MQQSSNEFLLVIAAACRLILPQHIQSTEACLVVDVFIPTQSLPEKKHPALENNHTCNVVVLSYCIFLHVDVQALLCIRT
jgi:FixJ family two-component response regulator